eukprot:tig00000396_g24872.t1
MVGCVRPDRSRGRGLADADGRVFLRIDPVRSGIRRRQLDAYSAKHLHRAIVYTANVNVGKPQGATDIAPDKFLAAVHDACARAAAAAAPRPTGRRLSARGSKLQDQIAAAREELAAASPSRAQSSHGNGPGTGSGASRPGLLDISGIALEGPVSPGSVGPVSPSSSSAYEPSSPLAGGPGRRPVPLGGLPRQGSGGSGLGSPAAPFVLPRSGSGPVSAGDGSSPAGRAPVSRSGSGSIRVPIIDARAHALAQASGSGLGSPTPAARDGAALG